MSGLRFLCASLFVLAMLASGLVGSTASSTQVAVLQLASLLH